MAVEHPACRAGPTPGDPRALTPGGSETNEERKREDGDGRRTTPTDLYAAHGGDAGRTQGRAIHAKVRRGE